MADGLLTHVRGRSGGGFGRVIRVRGVGGAIGQTRLTRVRGRAVSSVAPVYAGPDLTALEPFTIAALTGTGPGEDGDVTSWVWSQTAGPTVTLVGTGANRQYITPGTRTGTTVTFLLTATLIDSSVSTDTVTHTILAHGGPWTYVGGALTAVGINTPTI